MALLTCPDCGGNVSDSAPTCPHCGRPMKPPVPATPAVPPKAKGKSNASGCFAVIVLVLIVLVVIGSFSGPAEKKPDDAGKSPSVAKVEDPAKGKEDEACRQDLRCIGEKHLADASVYCKDPIEAQAAHDVKWTDGTFELKMSHYRWSNADKTAVTYIGDKVSFQNGFGAFTPMTYLCTLDVDDNRVIDVKVIEGRLPRQ